MCKELFTFVFTAAIVQDELRRCVVQETIELFDIHLMIHNFISSITV